MFSLISITLVSVLLVIHAVTVYPQEYSFTYDLMKVYSGDTFFDEWNFYEDEVGWSWPSKYLNYENAVAAGLAYIDPYTKHAIIMVDNTTSARLRGTIRMTTQASYDMGSLWIADIFHTPYGCGVNPSMISQSWAYDDGTIFMLTASDKVTSGQIGLSTSKGCDFSGASGRQTNGTLTCDRSYESCDYVSLGSSSHGPDFNNGGGGIFVTEYTISKISIWYIPRSDARSTILTASDTTTVDILGLGFPVATWTDDSCGYNGFSEFFGPQVIQLGIGLCSGPSYTYYPTCPGTSCATVMFGDKGSELSEAYFEIGSIRVFKKSDSSTIIPTTKAFVSNDKGILIGAIMGAVGGFLILLAAVLFVLRRQRLHDAYLTKGSKPGIDSNASLDESNAIYAPKPFYQRQTIDFDDKNSLEIPIITVTPAAHLTQEEQLNILVSGPTVSSSNLNESEMDILSMRREIHQLRQELASIRENATVEPAPPIYTGRNND